MDIIDVNIGKQLKERRKLIGLSQAELAQKIGLTFQQLQKYEKGVNRITAAKLLMLSRLLKVDLEYFYTGLPEEHLEELGITPFESTQANYDIADKIGTAETAKLLREYYKLPKGLRTQFANTIKSTAELAEGRQLHTISPEDPETPKNNPGTYAELDT